MQESKLKSRCIPKTLAFNNSSYLRKRRRINTESICVKGTQIDNIKSQSVSQKTTQSISYCRQQFLNFCTKPKLSLHTEQSEFQNSDFIINNFITTSKKKSIFNIQLNIKEYTLLPRPKVQNQNQQSKMMSNLDKVEKFRNRFYTVQLGPKTESKSEQRNMNGINVLRYKRLEPYFTSCFKNNQ